MTNRVSMKALEDLAQRINKHHGAPLEYASKEEKFKANIGHRYIYASGTSHSLAYVGNEGGGISTRFGSKTKRELFDKLDAYLQGLED